ncbi:hypothetical protein, partial [Campylobacter jejuni]|uniref:hypothetical protein n=1 Tax=Campylobacter jejuni TaxID=197 RepID=UPI00211C068A
IYDPPTIIRFWFCSTQAYDMFKPVLEELWELSKEIPCMSGEELGEFFKGRMGTRTKIEIMFYARDDYVSYPNAAAIAESIVLETYTAGGGWQGEDPSFDRARTASAMQMFNSPEVEDHKWQRLKMGLNCEDPESE